MNSNIFILFFIAFTCGFGQGIDVKVSVYYETLCPDSINFITDQFWPTYKKIGSEIKIDFVPFGKATASNKTGKWVFNCQHGPRECFANAYHACAIALYSKEESSEFIYCSMESNDPSSETNLRECAVTAGLTWSSLKICYESGQADKLQIKNNERTKAVKPKINFVPTIIFNDKFTEINQKMALNSFQKLICEYLNQQPEVCKDDIEVVVVH